ncbi:hypothetical protein Tco_0623952 [Tanacetum coccineum]|uniref:Uncharacterized protein n=1 Tax=Tanacetum coccineum TaxID=301880 RepID=A0ABQ4WCN6_9ASTR
MYPVRREFRGIKARGLEYGRYGVLTEVNTAYRGLLRVGTTFDIFQNILLLYLEYGVLDCSGYGVLHLVLSWSLVKCRHRYAVSSWMDTAYWMSESVFFIFLCLSSRMLTLFDVIKVDETQSTRLRYQTLTKNKGNTSSEVEPDHETLQLTTLVDIQAYLLSEDELAHESDEEEPGPSHSPETQALDSNSLSPDLKRFDNTLPLIERQLVKYLRKASIEGYYEENIDHREQTDKLVQATIDSLDKTATNKVNLLKPLNGVTETLKVVQDAVMDDPALNKKVIKATEAYTKNSSSLTELLSLAAINLISLLIGMTPSEINPLMTEILSAFKGENDTQADTDKPPSHTEGEHVSMEDDKGKEEPTREVTLIESSPKPPLIDPILEIPISQREGKAIATDDQPKLTEEQIKAHMNKEEQIKKAAKEAKMFKMTKIELIEVVQEEAEKIRLDPKTIICAKAGRKRKHMELEPEIKVLGLECNRSLPEGVPFVNNMVIEEPEYEIFFTDVFGDQALKRWNDIHKVGVDSLVSYLVMASTIKTLKNARFCLKLKKIDC